MLQRAALVDAWLFGGSAEVFGILGEHVVRRAALVASRISTFHNVSLYENIAWSMKTNK
jgi:hypothetical protein